MDKGGLLSELRNQEVNSYMVMDIYKYRVVPDDLFNGETQLASSAPTSSPLCSVMGRRAASFPVVNHQLPLMSAFPTMRSQSESAVLNCLGLANSRTLIINQIKRPETADIIRNEFSVQKCDSVSENDLSSGEEISTDASSIADESEDSDIEQMQDEEEDADTTKAAEGRKSVRFADSCGKPLTTVRVMKEPSDYPPNLDPAILKKVLGNYYKGSEDEEKPASTWVMTFSQPASDYIKFHETLEHGNVALENVMLKNEVSRMLGTVKVKNIAFEKNVFVRLTSDNWKTFTDHNASFQPSSSRTTDTFSFDFPIMSSCNDPDARIEFCVCYQIGPFNGGTPSQEFWDSNGGSNYLLLNRKEAGPGTSSSNRRYPLFGRPDKTDVYSFGSYDNWSKFASWKTVTDDAPYW